MKWDCSYLDLTYNWILETGTTLKGPSKGKIMNFSENYILFKNHEMFIKFKKLILGFWGFNPLGGYPQR